ncbi:MAG: asparagine synthase-related protein [archaeon]
MASDSQRIAELIKSAVEKSVSGLKKATVAFSGGVDSAIVAKIASEKAKIDCLAVGVEGKFEQAEKAAELLGLPLRKIRFKATLPTVRTVQRIIKTADTFQTGIALPFYFLCKGARTREILTGQGADELFLGYRRYYACSSTEARRMQKEDIEEMWEKNGKRDSLVAASQGKVLINPFLDERLVKEALKIPIGRKLADPENRKIVLRRVAEELGIPREIAYAPKKAIQYSSGAAREVEKLLKRLKRRGG